MRRVLFIGAGASAPFGLPVTGGILPKAVDRLKSKPRPGLFVTSNGATGGSAGIADEDLLTEGLRDLYPGIDMNGSDLPDITQILSFLDYLIVNEQPAKPRWNRDKLSQLRSLIDRAICEVLSTELDQKARIWQRLSKYLTAQIAGQSDHLTVITTNYDLTLDLALGDLVSHSPGGLTQIDLGFEFRKVDDGRLVRRPGGSQPPTQANKLALYKLHGSLNYLRCEVCDQVYLNPWGKIAFLAFDREPSYANTCHCGHGPLRHMIVAPSMVRSYRIPQLASMWAAATEALRIAEEWVFAGYSLPPEDIAIRSMLFRAWHARGQIHETGKRIDQWDYNPRPKITVVQRDAKAEPAYKLLFGDVSYVQGGFENWLPEM